MGTDRLLGSVPDFRSSASRDLALTNDFRTVALYHSLLTTHHSQPLLSSHYGSRSEEPSTVLRKGEKRRERERVREKRERKWGLTGSWRLYPIFALPTTNNRSYHPTLVLAQHGAVHNAIPLYRFHPTMVLAQRVPRMERPRGKIVSIPLSQLMHFELTKRGRRKWIEESAAEELRTKWMK